MESQKQDPFERVNPRLLKREHMQRCKLSECRGACCIFGVWVDQREMEDILAHSASIVPYMPAGCEDPQDWFACYDDNDELIPSKKVVHTAVETRPEHYGGTACIFLRDDAKCALQVAANELKEHPWRFKPYYCILHPLDLDDEGRITIDEQSELVNEPGSCLRYSEVPLLLVETFEMELRYLLGDKAYRSLRVQAGLTEEDSQP